MLCSRAVCVLWLLVLSSLLSLVGGPADAASVATRWAYLALGSPERFERPEAACRQMARFWCGSEARGVVEGVCYPDPGAPFDPVACGEKVVRCRIDAPDCGRGGALHGALKNPSVVCIRSDDEAEFWPEACRSSPPRVTPEPRDGQRNAGRPLGPCVGNPCNPATGNKLEREEDIGGAVPFGRWYNSVHPFPVAPELGAGWSHTWSGRLVAPDAVVSQGGRGIDALRPDGRLERFVEEAPGVWVAEGDPGLELRREEAGWVVHRSDGTREHYSGAGLLQAVEAPSGQRTTIVREGGRIVRVVGPFGHALVFRYEGGWLAGVKDPGGR